MQYAKGGDACLLVDQFRFSGIKYLLISGFFEGKIEIRHGGTADCRMGIQVSQNDTTLIACCHFSIIDLSMFA